MHDKDDPTDCDDDSDHDDGRDIVCITRMISTRNKGKLNGNHKFWALGFLVHFFSFESICRRVGG